ncbi:cytochrome c oxidase subunit 3 [Dehalobacter sp. DCM]|uniref:cytochrome c oxidase subunit 3 n=1 Tax=Dehalobacter sp. DCM TaxID=2907827 RepID=UPI0030820890|nr:cytochrome c oxidase subunit 3 [Dehalobacter sp. DCM]
MTSNASTPQAEKHMQIKLNPPGDSGVWIPITLDAFVFLAMFTFFTLDRIADPILFEQSRLHLNVIIGFSNTLVLLTSSWFVVKAVQAARVRIPAKVKSNLLFAMLLGLTFGVLKIVGYYQDIMVGHSITANQFFGYYFSITGLHFVHVMVGLALLTICFFKAQRGPVDEKYLVWIESGATFWHMVDMLWVMIFPMFYLLRAI